ncbi:hypothetical protein [Endozoicomonas sp. ONNA2]|uniref:hypothetical protein n=1 Tax=Endozoicomonas sp. ONNA2 TaxID=2828741 RepID=UPI0021494D11|nr:hypothetical protein [Endozoicomonas sp. ONNA2]
MNLNKIPGKTSPGVDGLTMEETKKGFRQWLEQTLTSIHRQGPVSVILSNLYLHYVLDLWFERKVKPCLKGEAWLIRYVDDFVVCFQHRSDAERFMECAAKAVGQIWSESGAG